MSDKFPIDEELERLIRSIHPPKQDDAGKEALFRAAEEAFDKERKKNASAHQGNGFMQRLKHIVTHLSGDMLMHKRYIYGSGLALGAVALLSYTAISTNMLTPPAMQETTTAEAPVPDTMAPPPPAVAPAPHAPSVVTQEAAPMLQKRHAGSAGMTVQGYHHIAPMPAPAYHHITPPPAREQYPAYTPNAVKQAVAEPLSTFSIDVDTSSYARMRGLLSAGVMPQPEQVRVEEFVNYFTYNYPAPTSPETPLLISTELTDSPWTQGQKLLRVGIKGYDVAHDALPPANLVFLVDVSGSMQSQDKLPLLKDSLRLLVNRLNATDSVAIVTYASSTATALPATKVSEKNTILAAIDALQAGGGTSGEQGLALAYETAQGSFVKDGINRIFLATDGDFNLGISDPDELKHFITEKRKSGVYLSVLGFGTGNYNDAVMQSLAQNGNGQAYYIDSITEARRALVDDMAQALFPIAKDVKIQVEFNPAEVKEYRLVGYETRALRDEDFNNDKVDAGEIGAGHEVTALYEIAFTGEDGQRVDDLRYSPPSAEQEKNGEIAFLKLRYTLPQETESKLISAPVLRETATPWNEADASTRFAVAVASFAQKLRKDSYADALTYQDIAAMAEEAKEGDATGKQAEFINLVKNAAAVER